MPHKLSKPKYLLRWDHSRALEIDRDVVVTPHRLCELALNNRENLKQTLQRHPADAMSVFTMGSNPAHSNEWRTGDLGKCTGTQLIEAVEQGRLILVLHDVAKHHSQYDQITKQLYSELTECHVGLRVHAPAADIVLASPAAMQYYRCEHRPTVRWQLLGQQTILTYPVTSKFIDCQSDENVVVDQCNHSLYFQPEFDDHATTFQLKAGEMLSMPHPTPHRVQLGDGLNVWLQTQHDTPASYRRRNIYAANRVLRKLLPESFCSPKLTGAWSTIKSVCARACGLTERYGHAQDSNEPTFVVQPTTHRRVASNAATSNSEPLTTPITGLVTEPTTTTPVVLEN